MIWYPSNNTYPSENLYPSNTTMEADSEASVSNEYENSFDTKAIIKTSIDLTFDSKTIVLTYFEEFFDTKTIAYTDVVIIQDSKVIIKLPSIKFSLKYRNKINKLAERLKIFTKRKKMFYFEKQPNEIINGVGIDFTNWLDNNETIESYNVTADKEGIVSSIAKSGNTVLCTVANGEDGDKIKLTYTIETSNGNKYESEIILNIKEM